MDSYEQSLRVIEQGGFLAGRDLQFLQQRLPSIADNWAKQQRFRTRAEMESSVLSDARHATRAAKYWQSVREQAVMYDQLVRLSFEYRRNEVALQRAESRLDDEPDGWERALIGIECEERLYNRLSMIEIARDRVRELREWDALLDELDDGSFDTRDPGKHQWASLPLRYEQELRALTPHTAPADAISILGRHQTMVRLCAEREHQER